MTRLAWIGVLAWLAGATLQAAEPTELRAWHSTTGTKIEAKATAINGTTVTLETATGRVAKAAIEKAFCRAYIAAMLEEKMAAAWGERDKLD